MADASSPGMIATLVPVIIGGAIALAGTWLGPWITERHKEKAEKKKRRAEKFEELMQALFEVDHWVNDLRQVDVYGKELPSILSPFWKLHAISATYFPQFETEVKQLDAAVSAYRLWMTKAGQHRLAGRVDKMNEGFDEAYPAYAEKREALLNALKDFATKEFQ